MTAESRSLATALQRARVASGLLRPSYTISGDTTNLRPVVLLNANGCVHRARIDKQRVAVHVCILECKRRSRPEQCARLAKHKTPRRSDAMFPRANSPLFVLHHGLLNDAADDFSQFPQL